MNSTKKNVLAVMIGCLLIILFLVALQLAGVIPRG